MTERQSSDSAQSPRFVIVGAGNGGLAIAGHLALKGHPVAVYGRREEKLKPIREAGGLELAGAVQGFAPVSLLTTDIEEALAFADTVLVVVPASAHRDVAEKCAPYLGDDHVVVLLPGRTGGAMEFSRVLRENGNSLSWIVAETGTFPYASRHLGGNLVRVFGLKKTVTVAALPALATPLVLSRLHFAFPEMTPALTVLRTSLDNLGAIFHPAPTVLNAARIHETGGAFDHYHQGISPEVARILEAMDRERVAVAAALGAKVSTALEWLHQTYGVGQGAGQGTGQGAGHGGGQSVAHGAGPADLYSALQENKVYAGIAAATDLNHRYITEDVPCSLVPIASLGQSVGVPTPTIRSIIYLASLMTGVQFWLTGRTVDKLGLSGLSAPEIRRLAEFGSSDVPEEVVLA